jgi:Tfp pilus assembly protein PilE
LIVISILAVLASVAMTGFNKTKYKTEKNLAITYLRAIRTAEKLYWVRWKTYLALASTAAINTQFGTEIKLTNWTSFVVTAGSGTIATTFAATATSDAASGSKTLALNEAGTWSGSYTPLPSY